MTRTLLLADDSVTIQKVVELTFLDEDVRVVSVSNGTEAIERAAEVAPDVVLADVHMPGADGYSVCEAIRQRTPGTPVLLLVGTFEVFDSDRAAQVGAAGHLKKPFDSQELMRQVHGLMESAPPADAAAAPEAVEEAPVAPAEEPVPEASETAAVEPAEAAAEPEGETWSFEPVEDEGAPMAEPPPMAPPVAEPVVEAAPVEPDFAPAPVEPEPAPAPAAEPVPEPEPVAAPAAAAVEPLPGSPLSDDDVDRIARRLLELGGDRVLREVAWEVVPDLAEVLLKARIRELEASVE